MDSTHVNPTIDPRAILDSLVGEFECLLDDAPLGSGRALTELFGALLVFNLDGHAELVPSPPMGLSTRALRTWRIARAARRIAALGHGNPAATVDIAAALIERSIDLIDPELSSLAA